MTDEPIEGVTEEAERRWGHRWGFADTRFVVNEDESVTLTGTRYDLSGYRMYEFIPYVEEVLNVQLDLRDRKQEVTPEVPPPQRNEAFCREVEASFRADQVSFDDRERLLRSHGQTTSEEVYKVLYGRLERVADMVFHCESEEDAASMISLAGKHDVCLVPYGGGTSVSCALQLPASEMRMVVAVDMRRMNRIEWIDRENLRACVQAGITGMRLELELARAGFTSGHEPDSIELSTLGGWIATNASGMKKNRYGNIEQIVEQVTLMTPAGVVEHSQAMPRVSMGIQPQSLLFGSEGNLGLITKAIIRVHPLPEVKEYEALLFPDFDSGVGFLYELAHGGFVPASIRLVDNLQFRFGQALKPRPGGWQGRLERIKKFYVLKVRGFDPHKMAAATVVMEGSRTEVDCQKRRLYTLAKKYRALPAGSENGRRGYRLTYAIAYIRDFLADFYVIGETLETSTPWSRIRPVCAAVQVRLEEEHRRLKLPGRPYLSYRVTQVYHTGVCIYFMFGVYARGVKQPEHAFARIEHSLREAIMESGGSISHHHGVGKLRSGFMPATLSSAAIELLRKVKKCNDPQNIFGIRNSVFSD